MRKQAHCRLRFVSHHWHIELGHGLALEQAQRERRLRKIPEPRRAIAVNLQWRVAPSLVYVDAGCNFRLCTEACASCWRTYMQENTP